MVKESIEQLIADGESTVCEFKTSFNKDSIETLVAFANTDGGDLFVGVNDSGKIVGVNINDETVQTWINEIKSKTTPSLIPEFKIYTSGEKNVVRLSVKEYPAKPVAVRGRYFKRTGNSNHLLDISEVVDMHLRYFNTSWDFQLNSDYGLSSISTEKVQLAIDSINKRGFRIEVDPMGFLLKNDLIRNNKITNAAFLLFSKNDTVFTTIELGRFQTETIIKDSQRTKSDILSQIDEVIEFVKKHINKEVIIKGQAQNVEKWAYPLDAIREIVINMIVHRDYSLSSDSIVKIFDDKIEFYNPGRLPASITVDDLLTNNYKSTPRNKIVADFFKDMGLIEKYGSGIQRILHSCKENDLPLPVFRNISDGFEITIYAKADKPKESNHGGLSGGLSGGLKDVLFIIKNEPGIQVKEIKEKTVIPQRTLERYISQLLNMNAIERRGSRKTGGYWALKE